MNTRATYYDGRSARAHDATLNLLGSLVQVQLHDRAFNIESTTARIVPPIGRGTWTIELEDRAQIRFDDDEFGEALSEQFGANRLVGRLENSWPWAIAALLVAVAGTWAILTIGVPFAAQQVAQSIPAELDERLGDESIGLLDRLMFDPSTAPASKTSRMQDLFEEIKSTNAQYDYYRIEFRSAPAIGANAFAIPGGLVVVTDEMVEIIESDAEIIAILAHEIGHLANRHGLRILLQESASALIIASLTGDLSNITALSATIPAVLMQAKYSRDFEREADEFAFDYMVAHDIDTDALSELLLRIDSEDDDELSGGVTSWLSSHPRSSDRKRDVAAEK